MENSNNESTKFLITTIDNPFNPFTEFDEWYKFDTTYGYNTYQNLVLLGDFDDDLSDDERAEMYEQAMEQLLRINPMYIKVTNNTDVGDKMRKLREILLEESKKIS